MIVIPGAGWSKVLSALFCRAGGTVLLLILGAWLIGVLPSKAADALAPEDECYTLDGADPNQPSGELRVGRLIGDGPAEFFPIVVPSDAKPSPGGLPEVFAHPGDLLAIGQTSRGFVCGHFTDIVGDNENHGWLRADRVQIQNPASITLPLSAWIGAWRAVQESATIELRAENGALHLIGDAVYPNPNEPKSVGHVDAIARPQGNAVNFLNGPDDDQCVVSLLLVGQLLAVTDNDNCGGLNVRFADFYRLAPQ